jgi:hypothetical protein
VAVSGSMRMSTDKWLAMTENPPTDMAKISASSFSRCSIHSLRSSGTFAEEEGASDTAGDAVVPAGDGWVDEMGASHCHKWICWFLV